MDTMDLRLYKPLPGSRHEGLCLGHYGEAFLDLSRIPECLCQHGEQV